MSMQINNQRQEIQRQSATMPVTQLGITDFLCAAPANPDFTQTWNAVRPTMLPKIKNKGNQYHLICVTHVQVNVHKIENIVYVPLGVSVWGLLPSLACNNYIQ